ncbi:hypothetical protein N9I84_05450 [Gammaproteobacteria bacterium]|nr:hypothetical protein [Gammaproteobacteria bacterium]
MQSTARRFDVYMAGIIGFQDDESANDQLASIRTQAINLPEIIYFPSFGDVELEAPLSIAAFPTNNFTTNWSKVDTGNWVLSFGDEFLTDTPVTYTSRSEFSMNLQDDGAQIDGGSAGNADSMSGVFVSYNSSDSTDVDLYQSMPENTSYSTWGFWSLSASDAANATDSVSASVDTGFWVAGEPISFSNLPTSGSASMSGTALMDVAYRYDQSGSNYGVQRSQTTADVAATFNWGSSSWSGTMTVSNFDQDNPIVSNAGFTSFSFALDPSSNTFYSADSTDVLDNAWLGGASVEGKFFGGSSPEQTGGTINVNLYKSGSTDTSGANDFYVAEGIYLLD